MTEAPGSAPVFQGRSRAGNAMARTRVAVLLGARQCLIAHGSRSTMVDIAARSGVAKATLYNHFRTKSEVFAALVDHEITDAAAETAEQVRVAGLPLALARLAERIGEHPVVRRLAATEPGVLAGVLLPEQAGLGAASWGTARAALASLLGADADVELLLRYLVSQLLWPATRAEIEVAIGTLLGGSAPAPDEPAAAPAEPAAAPVEPAAAPVEPAAAPVERADQPAPLGVPAGFAPAASLDRGATVPGLGFPEAHQKLERVALG